MPLESKASEPVERERALLISKLVKELPVLRTKLGTSQDELATMIGVSRQTYSSIERKRRKMSWGIFLSLVLVFDANEATHDILRKEGIYPHLIRKGSGESNIEQSILSFVKMDNDDIKSHLDEQAIHAIETVIMVEYARCNNMTGDALIKAFEGKRITQVSDDDVKAKEALDRIRSSSGTSHTTRRRRAWNSCPMSSRGRESFWSVSKQKR